MSIVYARLETQQRLPDGKVSNIPLSRKSESFSVQFETQDQANEFNEIFIRELRNYGKNIEQRVRVGNLQGSEDRTESIRPSEET